MIKQACVVVRDWFLLIYCVALCVVMPALKAQNVPLDEKLAETRQLISQVDERIERLESRLFRLQARLQELSSGTAQNDRDPTAHDEPSTEDQENWREDPFFNGENWSNPFDESADSSQPPQEGRTNDDPVEDNDFGGLLEEAEQNTEELHGAEERDQQWEREYDQRYEQDRDLFESRRDDFERNQELEFERQQERSLELQESVERDGHGGVGGGLPNEDYLGDGDDGSSVQGSNGASGPANKRWDKAILYFEMGISKGQQGIKQMKMQMGRSQENAADIRQGIDFAQHSVKQLHVFIGKCKQWQAQGLEKVPLDYWRQSDPNRHMRSGEVGAAYALPWAEFQGVMEKVGLNPGPTTIRQWAQRVNEMDK